MASTCPFCNAPLDAGAFMRCEDKLSCGRCGEPLPTNFALEKHHEPVPVTPSALPPKPFRANRRVALAVVGVMAVMALGALIFALRTQSFRRANDYRRGPTSTVVLQAPAEWAAVGYLPAQTNVLAGVHVAKLLNDPLGKRLFDLPRPELLDLVLETVERWTRIKPAQIDHVIFGAEITNKLPQLVIVVRTVGSYSEGEMVRAMQPTKPFQLGARTVFRLPGKAGNGLLYCADDRTLVALVRLDVPSLDDLNAIPVPPRKGADGLSALLQKIFAERIEKEGLAWCAGDLEPAAALKDVLAFAGLPMANFKLLSDVKQFALSLYPQDGWTISGSFRASDEAAAEDLEHALKEMKLPAVRSFKVTGPPPDNADPAALWVQVQFRAAAEGIASLLSPKR